MLPNAGEFQYNDVGLRLRSGRFLLIAGTRGGTSISITEPPQPVFRELIVNHGFVRAAALLFGVLVFQFSNAEGPPGADSPEFLTAVESWLSDNDAVSLPALSRLAKSGNVAARLLLSRIESTDRGPTRFVQGLSRTARYNLFRQKTGKGRFRPSWLKSESGTRNPLAKALLESTALGINVGAIRRLYGLGEIQATGHLVRKVAIDGSRQQRQEVARIIGPDSELAPYLLAFLHADDGMTTAQAALRRMLGSADNIPPDSIQLKDDADSRAAMLFVDIGYQSGKEIASFAGDNKYYVAISRWIMTAPQAKPIASLCRRICSEPELPSCTNTAFGLAGGYYEVIRYDTPLEVIIPQARFLTSARAVGMAARQIAFAKSEADRGIFSDRELREKSQCLAAALAALKGRSS